MESPAIAAIAGSLIIFAAFFIRSLTGFGSALVSIPTVMWGRPDNGIDMLGDDFVTLRGVEEESRILGRLILDMLG